MKCVLVCECVCVRLWVCVRVHVPVGRCGCVLFAFWETTFEPSRDRCLTFDRSVRYIRPIHQRTCSGLHTWHSTFVRCTRSPPHIGHVCCLIQITKFRMFISGLPSLFAPYVLFNIDVGITFICYFTLCYTLVFWAVLLNIRMTVVLKMCLQTAVNILFPFSSV